MIAMIYSPPLRNILASGGIASMPALIASKHCSSGTGFGFQLAIHLSEMSWVKLECTLPTSWT